MGFTIHGNILIRYIDIPNVTEVRIPDGITRIEEDAFVESHLKSVYIPDTVTEIGYGAFEECTSLKHIDLPDGLEKIEGSAFFNTNIRELDIPESVREIGSCAVGTPSNDVDKIILNFYKNQRKTKILIEILWLGYTPEYRLLDFFDHPCYEKFSVLEPAYKIQIAVSYYDLDDEIKKYLKRSIRKAVTLAIDRNDTELLKILLNTGFVTKKNIDFLIQYAIEFTQKSHNPECQIILTDYKYQHFMSDTSQINKKLKL